MDELWVDDAPTAGRPRDDGRHARIIDGLDVTANPYKVGSLKWTHWRDAWKKADREMRSAGLPLKRPPPKDIK